MHKTMQLSWLLWPQELLGLNHLAAGPSDEPIGLRKVLQKAAREHDACIVTQWCADCMTAGLAHLDMAVQGAGQHARSSCRVWARQGAQHNAGHSFLMLREALQQAATGHDVPHTQRGASCCHSQPACTRSCTPVQCEKRNNKATGSLC